MEDLELTGAWWTEDMHTGDDTFPDGNVSGTLIYTPENGGKIDLIGAFAGIRASPEPQNIYGVTTDGERVTLHNARRAGTSMNSGSASFESEYYRTDRIYHGDFIHEDTRFWKIAFSFQHLRKWTDYRGLETPGDTILPAGPARSESAELPEADIVLDAFEDSNSALSGFPQRAYFNVYTDRPHSFEHVQRQYMQPLQNLITLCVGEAVHPLFISAYTERYGHRESRVKVYPAISRYQEAEEDKHPVSMEVTLPGIDFAPAVENWFSSFNRVEDFYDRYFSLRYSSDMYLESQFINLIVGLEMFHRETYPSGTYSDSMVWDHVRPQIIDRLPDIGSKKRMKDLINSIGNKYSLGDRLRDLNADYGHLYEHMFDVDDAVRDAVGARIDLAHGTNEEDMEGEELHRRKTQIDAIATAILHNVIGVDPEITRKKAEYLYQP